MSDIVIRFIFFLGILFALIGAETIIPRKCRVHPRQGRWVTNGIITILNTAMLNIMNIGIPLLAIGAALDANIKGWGFFNQINLPSWIEIITAVIILDFIVWAQHFLSHRIPFMWRFHRMHHSDRDLDVTSGFRFHPIEIALSMIIKIVAVYILGPTAIAVITFEIILNGMAMFNHANLKLPKRLNEMLCKFLVTPDMHRIHHSIYREEHDTNYGFSLSIWDKIFGCYTSQPRDGHAKMKLGLEWQDNNPTKLGWSLWLPFRKL